MSTTRPQVDANAVDEFLVHMNFKHEYLTSLGPNLYHYTDLAGLKGILENHDLWLSHSQYCNDDEEMTHGYTVAAEALAEARKIADTPYLQKIETMLKERPGVYICSFCDAQDLLNQWRNYAANGTGVSIEVETGWFSNLTGPDCSVGLFRFWKVYYDRDKQKGIINEAIALFQPGQARTVGFTDDQLARKAADAIEFFIPTFKNPAFFQESEWRLIFTPRPTPAGTPDLQPRFRVARNMLIPYYGLQDLKRASQFPPPVPGEPPIPLPVLSIRIGPSPNKKLNAQSARMILNQYGYAAAALETSDIPFRG